MFYLYFWWQDIFSASRQSCLFITIYFCGLLKKVLQSFVVKIGPGHTSIKKVYKNWCNFFPPQLYILSTFEEGCLFCYLISFLLSHEIKSLSSGFQIFAMIFLYILDIIYLDRKRQKKKSALLGWRKYKNVYIPISSRKFLKCLYLLLQTHQICTLPKHQST